MKSRGGDLQSVAREMSESVTDPDIQATEVRRGREGGGEREGGRKTTLFSTNLSNSS